MDLATENGPRRAQRGIQSVEVGGALLRALVDQGRPLPLKELAAGAGMTPAKAHPYLVSYGKLGLITQDKVSGRYGLGPLALQLGLIGLQQFEPVRVASARLPALAQAIGHTVALAVWGTRGPTIVRIEEAPTAVHVNMRHGTVLSLRGTASGRLFSSWLPAEQIHAVEPAAALPGAAPGVAQTGLAPVVVANAIDEPEPDAATIRAQGYAAVVGGSVPGVSAAAAPVFDATGTLVLGLTAIGPSAVFDLDPAGPLVTRLREEAREISAQLGAPV
ncbi:MAG: IclR family transcriptional regulator [Ideonella sp.]|nr:IclR family transcriptional regulator [Ideonella sp.]